MNRISFENHGSGTFLIYKIEKDDTIDSMSLGMLTNNKIPGLVPTVFTQMDSDKFLKYNVSSKIPVSQIFSGTVNKTRLLGVFEGIANALVSADDYMIDKNSIIFDFNCIYSDVSSCETLLICLPIENIRGRIDIISRLKEIMFKTKFDQTENCDYVAKIINYLNSITAFSANDFKNLILSLKNVSPQQSGVAAVNQKKYSNVVQPAKQNRQPVVNQQPLQNNQQMRQSKAAPKKTYQQKPQMPFNQRYKKEADANHILHGQEPEKQISLFYLLQHYNKENVEIYNAQKQSKKAAKSDNITVDKPNKGAKHAKPQSSNQQNFAFAVPGQSASIQVPSAKIEKPESFSEPMINNKKLAASRQKAAPYQYSEPPKQAYSQSAISGVPANFGETTVLGGGGSAQTTVLNMSICNDNMKRPYLIRKKNNEQIEINKPVFRIGKENSYVDYFIGDNTAISRSHANILIKNKRYYIVDTNSTNHTFINEKQILSGCETEIKDETIIRLANESFEFRLM